MARFIDEDKPIKEKEVAPQSRRFIDEDEQNNEADWHNLASTPSRLAGIPGFVGDILQKASKEVLPSREQTQESAQKLAQSGTPSFKDLISGGPLMQILHGVPTTQEIRQGFDKLTGYPSLQKEQSEDWPYRLATGGIPAAIGGFSAGGPLGAASALMDYGVGMGTSSALEPIGRGIGGMFGYPEAGSLLAGVGGVPLGIKGSKLVKSAVKKFPTSALPEIAEKTLSQRKERLSNLSENLYKKAEERINKIPGKDLILDAAPLEKMVEDLKGKSFAGVNPSEVESMRGRLDYVNEKISGGKISVKDAIDVKQSLNRTLREVNLHPVLESKLSELRNKYASFIDEHGKKDPRWWNSYKRADKVYEAYAKEFNVKKAPKGTIRFATEKLIDEMEKSKPVAATATGGLGALISYMTGAPHWKTALVALPTAAVGEFGRQASALRKAFKADPAIYKAWKKSVGEASKGNPKDLVALIPAMNTVMQAYDKEEGE